MKKKSVVAVAVAVLFLGCPLVQEAPRFSVQTRLENGLAQVVVTNPDISRVRFQLMVLDEDLARWFPAYDEQGNPLETSETAFGVTQDVTAQVVNYLYEEHPVVYVNDWYYWWDWRYTGFLHPLPSQLAGELNQQVSEEEITIARTQLVDSDGSFPGAQFELPEAGSYMIRVTGFNEDNVEFAPHEAYLPFYNGSSSGSPGGTTEGDAEIEVRYFANWGDPEGYVDGWVHNVDPSRTSIACWINVEAVWHPKPGLGDQALTPLEAGGYFLIDITTGGIDEQATLIYLVAVPDGTPVPQAPSLDQPYVPEALATRLLVRNPPPQGGSGAGGSGVIDFQHVPYFRDPNGIVSGTVTGVSNLAGHQVAVYIKVEGVWWQKPDCGALIEIAPDGSWSADITVAPTDQNATDVAAFLVPRGTSVPCTVYPSAKTTVNGITIPGALDFVVVNRVPLIGLSQVPPYNDMVGDLRGIVRAHDFSLYEIHPFILVTGEGWLAKPGFAPADAVAINPDGTWSADIVTGLPELTMDHKATQLWVLLFPFGTEGLSCGEEPCADIGPVVDQAITGVWINRLPGDQADQTPMITVLGESPDVVEVLSGPYSDPGATAFDQEDGDLTSSIITTSDVNTLVVGSYEVGYSVTDSGGNTAMATRVVQVVDTTPPAITLLGDNPQEVIVGSAYVDPGATATDNYDGDLTSAIVVESSLNIDEPGTYVVDYSVSDSSGNSATAIRTVVVLEVPTQDQPPEITILAENPHTVEALSGPYPEAGATALDPEDGDISHLIQTVSTVNMELVGEYTVTYTVTDSGGHTVTAVKTVYVVDTTPPVVNQIPDQLVIARQMIEVDLGNFGFDAYDASAIWSIISGDEAGTILLELTGSIVTITGGNVGALASVMVRLTDGSGNSTDSNFDVLVEPCESAFIEIVGEPGSVEGDANAIFGTVCGVLPDLVRVVCYVKVTVDGVDFGFAKPDFGEGKYTPVNSDGTWLSSIAPDGNVWQEVRAFLVEEGTQMPDCNPCLWEDVLALQNTSGVLGLAFVTNN